jgi:hypothetical protein
MQLNWQKYDYSLLDEALKNSFCLYVFHHTQDGDRPFYIGKAKYFGTKQSNGYKGSARYNSGYVHLVAGMLRNGFSLYIASLGEINFANAENYEQELIHLWAPVRPQKKKKYIKQLVMPEKPWVNVNNVND